MQISADLSSLSQGQREALSNFVLTFPEIDRRTSVEHVAIDRRKVTVDAPTAIEFRDLSDYEEFSSPEKAFAAIVPAAPVTLTLQAPGTDKSGLPWDERIHSGSKALTADGLWRKKRGVDDSLIAQVEGQLKQLMALPAPGFASTVTEIIAPAPTPIALVAAVPAPPIALEVVDGRQAFINFIGTVSKAIQDQKLTQVEILAVLAKYGIPTLPLLANRFDLVPQVAMDVEALIVSRS